MRVWVRCACVCVVNGAWVCGARCVGVRRVACGCATKQKVWEVAATKQKVRGGGGRGAAKQKWEEDPPQNKRG